jgi:hypothetical protein
MQTLVLQRHGILRRARSMLAALLAASATACSAAPEQHTKPGELDLSVVGVTEGGARYRVQGSFSVSGLDNGLHAQVSSAENPTGAVVRRPLPPGLYSVALNAGFELTPLTTGSDVPAAAAEPLRGELASLAPRLVIIESDKRAQVLLQSLTPSLRSEHPLARVE